jgi:RNA polymerase sigma-70 factor (ECF subfamily)
MLQDLFVKIIDKPHLFDPEKRFSAWIYAVASNMCKNEYRRRDIRKIEQSLPEPDSFPATAMDEKKPDEIFENKSFSEALYRKLGQLETNKSKTFLLRFQQQLSIKEISEVLDCSPGTVKSRLFYTIRLLADELHEYNPNTR